jgi:FtsP/CotA-like multicopper oxidase with cupredoxin domain
MLDRRTFLSSSAVGASTLFCSLQPLETATRADVRNADLAARKLARPRAMAASDKDRVDMLKFGTPEPQPGGVVREYWVEADTTPWNITPHRHDDWMDMPLTGKARFTAFTFREWTTGFASPKGPASMPGPILQGEVGDVLRVHVRNAAEKLGQAITMHPHGVRYTPDYDGTYMGDRTRAGGYIAPGEEFTYTWECVPESVGVWPYHDHGPNHTLNLMRGLFGAIIIRPKGTPPPDVEHVLFQHALAPNVTGLDKQWQCFNGKAYAGNTPTIRAKVGQSVAFHVLGGDGQFHNFHVHGHRWLSPAGVPIDNASFGPHESITARWTEDNPGRWLYHCHVFSHQDGGMAGWYLVDP